MRNEIKIELFNQCQNYIRDRISAAEHAIAAAREASLDDTKSSAGDKYETGRAMMQQEIDRNSLQLHEAKKLQQMLQQIKPEALFRVIQAGSLVHTNHGKFFIAISAGALHVGEQTFYAVSPASPIGLQLMGKRVDDTFTFGGKSFIIQYTA